MKTITIAAVALGILLASYSLYAQDVQPESFYSDRIDSFITSCEHQASMIDSKSKIIRHDAAIASIKASYYKTHKGQLIDEMLAQKLEMKRGKVDYFLVDSFYRFCETDLARSLADRFELMTAGKRGSVPGHVGKKETEPVD